MGDWRDRLRGDPLPWLLDEANPADMKNVREQLMLFRVVDREVRSGVMVADSDMKRYFQEHRDRFALPEEYTLSQILIKPRSPDDTADAKAKVAEITITTDPEVEHDVAIKVIRPEFAEESLFLRRFEHEAEALRRFTSTTRG